METAGNNRILDAGHGDSVIDDRDFTDLDDFIMEQHHRIGVMMGAAMNRIAGKMGSRLSDQDNSWFDPTTCDVEVRK